MKNIKLIINKKTQEYTLTIGNKILNEINNIFPTEKYSKIFIVSDEIVAPLFLDQLISKLSKETKHIISRSGEIAKNIDSIQKIWNAMKDAGCDRKSLVINLGGGVVCDMGGFAASTYMRGIDFINIPTTLLSQIDASVGGKTGIDFAGIKNLIGTFDQPKAVIIDIQTIKTLPKREFLSGFAEIIKHGLIKDKNYFQFVTSKNPLDFNDDELIEIISKSCEIKKEIVEKDETEKGDRKLLNFGHTIGHAIEALSLETDKPLLHGEAISIGMVAEAKISKIQNMISEEDFKSIEDALINANLPTSLRDHESRFNRENVAKQSLSNIFKKMQTDKKNVNGKINFTLLTSIGNAVFDQKDISEDTIKDALNYVSK